MLDSSFPYVSSSHLFPRDLYLITQFGQPQFKIACIRSTATTMKMALYDEEVPQLYYLYQKLVTMVQKKLLRSIDSTAEVSSDVLTNSPSA